MVRKNIKKRYKQKMPGKKAIRFNTCLEINSSYYFGSGILKGLPSKLSEYDFDKLFLITNTTVYRLYGEVLFDILKSRFNCDLIILPSEETDKNIDTLNTLCKEVIKNGASKDSVLLALGGGVIGNIVGLASALVYRGIRFVEIPTTALSQTDSALSNKQAVNSPFGKNHLGVYHAPIFIWSDVKLLLSERPRYIKSGLVESIKNGLISDDEFLNYLENKLNGRGVYSENDLQELILMSIQSKINILKRDPSEKKEGVILEYGHTFGHAIEKLSQGLLTHGEGVAIGMCIAAEVSHRMGYLDREGLQLHYYLLQKRMKMSLKLPHNIRIEEIIKMMESDNKKSAKGVKYVLLEKVGKILNPGGDYMVFVDNKIIRDTLERFAA